MSLTRVIVVLFFFVLFFSSNSAFAIDASRVYELIRQHKLDPDQLGILIEDEGGKLFALNADKKLKPASLTKVLTAGAALEYLGPDFKFETDLLTDAKVVNRRIVGSVYLRASGDPDFGKENLYVFLGALQKLKVQTIDGNVVIDDSRYSDIHVKDSRSWRYSVSKGNNYPLFVNVDPPSRVVPHSRQWRKAEARLRRLMDLNDRYVIYQNMSQPDLWTGHHFLSLLKKSGIKVKGKVIRGKVPESAEVLATVSNPLTAVIHDMLKSSNNFYADMMIRNLAAEAGEKPATVQAGMESLYNFLDQVGIDRDDYLLSCGAGFTHSNFITAGALIKILNYLRGDDAVSATFLQSLPVAGIDGTLRTRMRKTPAQGRVQAKTGYLGRVMTKFRKLDGVVALGGFADSLNGRVLTFVFVYNGTRPPSLVRAAFDKILVELVKEPLQAISSSNVTSTISAQQQQ